METNDAFIFDIPLDQLEGIDDFAFGILGMDRETVMEEFDDVCEDTRERCMNTFTCQGMYASYPIEVIRDGQVLLDGGAVLESPMLAGMMELASEVVLYAVTVHGFDVVMKSPDLGMFDSMFYNAWAIGASMSAHRWIKKLIADRAAEKGLHLGRSWAPGEDDLELELQETLFNTLDPSRIGIALTEAKLMSPMMSVSGFMGVSADPAIQDVGTDLPSCH